MKKTDRKRMERKRRKLDSRKIEAAKRGRPDSFSIEASVTIQAAKDADGQEKTPTFAMEAYNGGAMDVGFEHPVVVDLAGMETPSKSFPALMNHASTQIVGHVESVSVGDSSISAKGVVSGGGSAAEEVASSGRKGFPWQASIGANVITLEEVAAGETAEANGQAFSGPILIARKTSLYEISFVPIGADNTTSASVAAQARKESKMNKFEKWLEAKGFDSESLSDEQTKFLKASFDAEQEAAKPVKAKSAASDAPDLTAVRAEVEKMQQELEAERTALAINRVCAQFESPQIDVEGKKVDLSAHAIEQKWSAERTELEALRASRVQSPAIHSKSHDDRCSIEAMQAASILAAGVPLDSPHFEGIEASAMKLPTWLRRGVNDDTRQKYMDAAHEYSQLSAMDICRESLRIAGKAVPRGSHDMIQAAFSSMTLDNIFTTSVNAQLLVSYMEAGDSTMGWTSSADVPNFLQNERIREDAGDALERLAPDNEAKHETPNDVEETYKIARYAKQFTVDEQHIINDALNVLRSKPQSMGRAAARLRPDLVYSILIANAALSDTVALFHASHSNLQTSSALTEANLRTMVALIGKQRDNEANLNLPMTHIIVPTDLKHTAANLVDSPMLVYGADDETHVGSTNTLNTQEDIRVVSEGRLANGVTDPASGTANAGSATTWFAASDQGHTIEVGYLRGSGRAPRVRTTSLTQGKYGLNFDVSMDIGAKALDYRALAKSTA